MIKVENVEVWGFEHAIRGMRNPMNSWNKSDTEIIDDRYLNVGKNDLDLMRKLYKAGQPHRKYLRQIMVSADVVCHSVWWSEFDTYKVGVTRNSCSKMHKIHVKEFEKDDFSHEGIDAVGGQVSAFFKQTLEMLEWLRVMFNTTKEKKYWRALIELLPSGYNMRATITFNYENAVNMIEYREGHKLTEWNIFVQTLKNLPYMREIISEAE